MLQRFGDFCQPYENITYSPNKGTTTSLFQKFNTISAENAKTFHEVTFCQVITLDNHKLSLTVL